MNAPPHPPRAAAERRSAFAAEVEAETGIDEAMIETLVRAFYRHVREDALLAPIFAAVIEDWEPHLQRMFAFWSSVALMSGHYHGRPMAKHAPLPIDTAHFDRWLTLFEATAKDVCPPAAAAHFALLARRVGESLELGIAAANGVFPNVGERYRRA